MRSDLNRTKDWSWPDNAARTRFDHWRVLSNNRPYSFVPEVMEGDGQGELYEGWWNIKVRLCACGYSSMRLLHLDVRW